MVEHQAPELVVLCFMLTGDDLNVDKATLQNHVSTKTDIYAYAMIALQVC